MRQLKIFLMALFCVLLPASFVEAEDLKVTPKISKFNTELRFDESKDYINNQLIVKFKESVTEEQKKQILQSVNGNVLSTQENGNFTLVSTPKSLDLTSMAKELLKHKEIEFVEPNYQMENSFTPKDPLYSKQWHLKKIQASKAWDQTKGASSVIVAVIDGGVQLNHPDLVGKIVYPYNTVSGGTSFPPNDHATHVAGIIAATLNQSGGAGVAPNVKIMPINVFSGDSANMFDVAEAIIYAADHNVDIINMSLGGYRYSYTLDSAAEYAKSKGILLIAAAGNEDTNYESYPAALDAVLGVSALNSSDIITDFSNFGHYIDFAAPGEGIYSTISKSKFSAMNGTSMASPIVAGVAALILSKNPLLTSTQVEAVLKKSSVDLGSSGWDSLYGYGRVDAYRSLQFTQYPISNVALSSSTFTMSGSTKTNISFSTSGGSKVSLYIQDSKGKIVKKLISGKAWSGGKVSVSWDGKLDGGTYAVGGTYKVLAMVSGNNISFNKSSTLKVVDKVVPSINLSGSAIYSPPATGKLAIPYELNKNAKVTANIMDINNKVVKTILSNYSVSAGKKTIYWDGKNNNGKKVNDGSFNLVMSVIDANKLKGISRKFAIKLDSTTPTGKVVMTSPIFIMDGTLKKTANIDVNETVYITAYVTTDTGEKIKTLVSNKSIKKGTFPLSWNGQNDKSQFVAEGKYNYLIELRDAAGNKTSVKSALFNLQDWNKPVIQGSADFYFNTEGNAAFSYTLSKPGMVTIQILNNGTLVKTIEENLFKLKGKQTFNWDGKDKLGTLLTDGKYTYKISIVDAYKLTQTYIGNMNLALNTVEIHYPSAVQLMDDRTAEVYYHLSHQANVTVEIYNGNIKLRTIMAGTTVSKGINSFEWDGYDDDEYPVYGDVFTYKIKAISTSGKETTISGKITNDEDPEWLIDQKYSFTLTDDDLLYSHLNLELIVNEPVKFSLYVFDDEYSEEYKDLIQKNLLKGINNLVYAKADIWDDDDYYLLVYTDSLGNEYYYAIDEYSYSNSYSINTQKFESDVDRSLVEQPNL
jgi:subtilisin family serine protease